MTVDFDEEFGFVGFKHAGRLARRLARLARKGTPAPGTSSGPFDPFAPRARRSIHNVYLVWAHDGRWRLMGAFVSRTGRGAIREAKVQERLARRGVDGPRFPYRAVKIAHDVDRHEPKREPTGADRLAGVLLA